MLLVHPFSSTGSPRRCLPRPSRTCRSIAAARNPVGFTKKKKNRNPAGSVRKSFPFRCRSPITMLLMIYGRACYGTIAAVKPLLQQPNSPMAMAALRPSPSGYDITAETTGLHLKPRRPGGQPSVLVLRLAVTETHNWFGIGGRSGRLRRPRRLSRDIRLPLASSGPDYLRSGDDCRRLIARTTMHDVPAGQDSVLPPDYRAVHDMMLSDPESSC